ncbi:hypothetical protein ACHAXN_009663 [Cyclotella atomus]
MSAYASLPGSFLPPFFSFGGNSPTKSSDDSTDATTCSHGEEEQQKPDASPLKRQPITPSSSISCPDFSDEAKTGAQGLPSGSSSPDITSTLPQSAPTDAKSSPASEIFIAINNARVDTVQLIQSLTTRGSNIARRTANFISRSSDDNAAEFKRSDTNDTSETDAQTVQSKPSLCYEDSDDSDDEMSFYDYGDEDDYNMQPTQAHQLNDEQSISSKSQDEDAIQFELFINFHGREYRAFRAFSTFVQLRNDLLRDRSVPSTVSIPELPSLNEHHENSSTRGFHALARSGFAMLQATAKMYCPVMELWLRSVVEVVPSSPILNKFLWEPLASSTAGWNDIDEMSGEKCGKDGLYAKPPRPSCNKSRQGNSSGLRYRSKSYSTSLSSITELLDES